LYDPSGTGQDLKQFLTTLTADIVEANGRDDIVLTVSAPDNMTLEPNITVPLALVVAEAVSNAMEHGLPDRGGTVAVALETGVGGSISLRIADDGNGVPPGFEAGAGPRLGLRISRALAAQMGGHFALERAHGGGAVARLELPGQPA
jgi:two-component sensor histidine kinase